MSDGRKALMASVTVLSEGFEVASETPRKTNAQNPTDSERRISGPAESAATPSTAPERAHE